jgi:hypothetical protein
VGTSNTGGGNIRLDEIHPHAYEFSMVDRPSNEFPGFEPPNLTALQTELARRLPMRASWHLGGMNWDWDFLRTRNALFPLQPDEITGGNILPGWLPLHLFGKQDFYNGGGASPFVGVHQFTGAVYGLDLERDTKPMYLMNSSVARFIETFLLLDPVLGQQRRPAVGIRAKFRAVDPEVYELSEWRFAIDEIERESTFNSGTETNSENR